MDFKFFFVEKSYLEYKIVFSYPISDPWLQAGDASIDTTFALLLCRMNICNVY